MKKKLDLEALKSILTILNLNYQNHGGIFQPEKLNLKTLFCVFRMKVEIPSFLHSLFSNILVKKLVISNKLASYEHEISIKLAISEHEPFFCGKTETELQVETIFFTVEKEYFKQLNDKYECHGVHNLDQMYDFKLELSHKIDIETEVKFVNGDLTINTKFNTKKSSHIIPFTYTDVINFKSFEEMSKVASFPTSNFFQFLNTNNSPIKSTILNFELTNDSFEITHFVVQTKMKFFLNEKECMLNSVKLNNGAFTFLYSLIDDEIYESNIVLLDEPYSIKSENWVSYCNLKIHKLFFNENVSLIKEIPKIYHGKPCKIESTTIYNADYSIKSSTDHSIFFQLTKFIILKVSNKSPKFVFKYHEFEFNFNELNEKGEFINSNFCKYSSELFSNLYDHNNQLDLYQVLQDFEIGRNLLKYDILKYDRTQNQDKKIIICLIDVGKITLKFEECFLEFSANENDILIRFPLQPRENIEVFIKSFYNSITDEKNSKSLNVQKIEIKNVTFHFS
eukprot:gene10056-2480_t